MRNRWIAPVFTAGLATAVALAVPGVAQAHVSEAESHTGTVTVVTKAWPNQLGSLSGIAVAVCHNVNVWPRIARDNGVSNPRLLQIGVRLRVTCTGAAPVRAQPASSSGWVAPLSSWSLSSCYGMRFDPYYHVWRLHDGLDMSIGKGVRIHAVHAGVVIRAGWAGGWGNMVEINHGGGVTTLYAHQSRIAAWVGQRVAKGQTIGYVGSTGASTGNHLHLRLHLNGKPANPAPFLRARGIRIGC
jgi:murein DD-endopeptidase MepM/ murein hydrolase activator NlpD